MQAVRKAEVGYENVLEQLKEMREENREMREYFKSLALQKKAKDLINEDTSELRVPWNSFEDMEYGLNTPAKYEALKRLLISDFLNDTDVHFMRAVFKVCMTEEFEGYLHVGLPSG